jgi:hypothetical protein
MKIKTSITLSQELINMIDRLPGQYQNRSFFLETAAWAFIASYGERSGTPVTLRFSTSGLMI